MGTLVVLVACVVGGFFAFRYAKARMDEFAGQFASNEPVIFEVPQSTPERIEQSLSKFEAIRSGFSPPAPGSSTPPSPPSAPAAAAPGRLSAMVLTTEDLNNLLNNHPELSQLKGMAKMKVENGLIHSQLSIDLEEFGDVPADLGPSWIMPEFEGRYLNGQAAISLGMAAGRPVAHLEDLKVGNLGLPKPLFAALKSENLLKSYDSNPKMKAFFDQVQDIRVEGDRIVIVPK